MELKKKYNYLERIFNQEFKIGELLVLKNGFSDIVFVLIRISKIKLYIKLYKEFKSLSPMQVKMQLDAI